MSYVILDLEWNGSYSKSKRKFVNEIIEIGAVKIDEKFNLLDTFSALIKPQIGKKICNRVRELTKITNDELNEFGISFQKATKLFTDFAKDSVIMTWGDSDVHALIDNYLYYTGSPTIPFMNNYCDVQKYCEKSMRVYNSSNQIGLSKCAEMLGVEFSEEEQHRATADAVLTLKCIRKLVDKFPIESYIEAANNAEFYNKIKFKAHFITNLKDPEIDRNQLNFHCEECGSHAKRLTKWKHKNKGFFATFHCENCNKKFIGRLYFKKKYDGVQVSRNIHYITDNEQKQN